MDFLFPTFLIALAAAAVPVVIHLFNFRKFKRLPFSNVKFLQEIRQETDSRSRIKHWLILATRVLTLVFLVLAFAQPYFRTGKEHVPGGEYYAGFYIDNSYSMGGAGSEGMLFDQAREKARQLASSYPLNTRFQLFTNEFKGAHRRWVSHDEFTDLLDEISISPSVRTFDEVLSRMEDSFENAPDGQSRAYVFSDFQKNFMKTPVPAVPDSNFDLSLIRVRSPEMANIAIDSIWFISPVHQAGGLEKLIVRLRNYSDEPAASVPLKLLINGRQEALGNRAIPARTALNDTLAFRSESPGWTRGELSIVDYPITFDDQFFFSYRVAPRVNVLLISGDGGGAKYLKALFGGDEFIDLTINSESQVDYSLIPASDLVILSGLSRIASGLGGQLETFVRQGGSLTVFPPRPSTTSATLPGYNEFLRQLGAGTYGDVSLQANQVVRMNLQQEVFRDVFEYIPGNPDLPGAKRYFRLVSGSRTRAESLLAMRGDEDLLARYSSGEGAVYLSAVALDEEDSNFPRHALFVPLLYRMALLSTRHYPLYYVIGKDPVVRAGKLEPEEQNQYRIRQSDFETIPSIRRSGAGSELFLADQIAEPGNYSLVDGNETELMVFSFNGSRAESDLSYLGEDALADIGGASTPAIVGEGAPGGRLAVENFGVQLWKYCVVLALIFLAAEILLIKYWPVARKI